MLSAVSKLKSIENLKKKSSTILDIVERVPGEHFRSAQPIDHGAAVGVGQGAEHEIELCRIVKHVLNYQHSDS